jgi:hypothetical protein
MIQVRDHAAPDAGIAAKAYAVAITNERLWEVKESDQDFDDRLVRQLIDSILGTKSPVDADDRFASPAADSRPE